MNIYPLQLPRIVRFFFPNALWRVKTERKVIYLTFDDGPTPQITDWVLELLARYDARATFFCIGKNVEAHPDIFHRILQGGHAVGNHTYNHDKGFCSSMLHYFRSIEKANELIGSRLFRPPYGRITSEQIQSLTGRYKMVLWDVITGDFEKGITSERIVQGCKKKIRRGSIVIFHDSEKTFPHLKEALGELLEHFHREGYRFEALNEKDYFAATEPSGELSGTRTR